MVIDIKYVIDLIALYYKIKTVKNLSFIYFLIDKFNSICIFIKYLFLV